VELAERVIPPSGEDRTEALGKCMVSGGVRCLQGGLEQDSAKPRV